MYNVLTSAAVRQMNRIPAREIQMRTDYYRQLNGIHDARFVCLCIDLDHMIQFPLFLLTFRFVVLLIVDFSHIQSSIKWIQVVFIFSLFFVRLDVDTSIESVTVMARPKNMFRSIGVNIGSLSIEHTDVLMLIMINIYIRVFVVCVWVWNISHSVKCCFVVSIRMD